MSRYGLQALALGGLSLAGMAVAQEVPQQPEKVLVGEVIIIGNEVTPDWRIRSLLPFYPNEILDPVTIKRGERNLERSGLFLVDRACGIRPTVTVLDREGDGPYRAVLVQITEKYRFPYNPRLCELEGRIRRGLNGLQGHIRRGLMSLFRPGSG